MKIKSIRDVKISVKLLLLALVSIVGLLILGGESVSTARQINQVGAELNDVWINAVIVAEELNTSISDYRIQESRHAITTDLELMAELEKDLLHLANVIEGKFQTYKRLPTRETDQMIIQEAEGVWKEYLECSKVLIETSKGNDRSKATELMMGESQELFNKASNLFLKAVERTKFETAVERERADNLYKRLSNIKLVVIALVSLIVIGLSVYLIRGIREPMEELAEAARRATSGNLDLELDYQSGDEIGTLTEAMNLLIKRLRDIISDEIRMFQEIGNENFDVRSHCEQAYRGDFAPILYAFTSLQSRLKEMDRQQDEKIERLKEENRKQMGEKNRLQAKVEDLEKRLSRYEAQK